MHCSSQPLNNKPKSNSFNGGLSLNAHGGLKREADIDPDSSPENDPPIDEITFNASDYLHPKYWGIWLGLGMFWLVTRLPFDQAMSIGRLMGRVVYWLMPRRRHITATNIALAFAHLSAEEQAKLTKSVFYHVGMTSIENAWMWFRSLREIEERFTISGLDHLNKALESDKGVILLQAHFSMLELSGAYLGPIIRVFAVYAAPKNPMLDNWMLMQRERRLMHMVEKRSIRDVIRHLKRGNTAWYSPDQHVGASHGGIPTQFFDQPVLSSNGSARIVRMSKATIIPMIPTRHQNGRSYHIAFFSPLELDPSDEATSTQALNDLFEKHIRQYPEQYYWLHRRFKPPLGEPNPYAW